MAIETGTDPSEAWTQIKRTAQQYDLQIPSINATLLAGDVIFEYVVLSVWGLTNESMQSLNDLALISGLDSYVASLPGLGGYVATTEIAVTTGFMQDALDWINVRSDGVSLTGDDASVANVSGSIVKERFTSGQSAGLRTILDQIDASIT